MIIRCTFLICIFTTITQSASINPRTNRVCPDGKTTPLFEGEDNVFPCVYECPTGFTCEYQDSPEGGICCPDLDILYDIYADERQKESKRIESTTLPEDVFDLPNVPNSPVLIVDDKESSNPKSQTEQPQRNEIRRAPTIRPATTELPTLATTSTQKFSIVTLSATRSKSVTPSPTKSPIITQPKKIVGLNCRRQQLNHKCNGLNGLRQSTQYVIRWYKNNGACHSYIYGYCPGTRIDMDLTLRTKDDCEALCLSADEFQQSDLFKFLSAGSENKNEFVKKAHAAPLIQSAETIELLENETPKSSEIVYFRSNNDGPVNLESNGQFLNVPIETTLAPQKRCDRPPVYRTICQDSNLPSQFTIRWYNQNGVCTAYGFGYCHGETVFDNESLKSKHECVRYCPGVSKNSGEIFDPSSRLIR